MPVAADGNVRMQVGAKALALVCFAIAAALLVASLFVPAPERTSRVTGSGAIEQAQLSMR